MPRTATGGFERLRNWSRDKAANTPETNMTAERLDSDADDMAAAIDQSATRATLANAVDTINRTTGATADLALAAANRALHIAFEAVPNASIGQTVPPLEGGVVPTRFLPDATLVTRQSLGIDQVENTRDLDKPISTATQQYIDSLGTQGGTVTKASIGLGEVNNTSDAKKPISEAVASALQGKASNAPASGTAAGLMSATDKNKLDGLGGGSSAGAATVRLGAPVALAPGEACLPGHVQTQAHNIGSNDNGYFLTAASQSPLQYLVGTTWTTATGGGGVSNGGGGGGLA